jgi:hypothetical protein
MKKRLQGRKPVAGLGTAAVDGLRAHRDGTPEGAPIKVSRKLRADVRRIARKVTDGMRDTRLNPLAHGEPRRRKPADETEDLFAILAQLVRAISLIRTTKHSLEYYEESWDEITTLEAAIEMLRLVDMALNDVADGRPSRIRPDETEDEADDEEGAE